VKHNTKGDFASRCEDKEDSSFLCNFCSQGKGKREGKKKLHISLSPSCFQAEERASTKYLPYFKAKNLIEKATSSCCCC
jgi:hypothetical protein